MEFLKEKHLRIKTPVTTDGVNLAYDGLGQPKFIVTHLPASAKKHLLVANRSRPTHLRMVIEEIDPISGSPATLVSAAPAATAIKPKRKR